MAMASVPYVIVNSPRASSSNRSPFGSRRIDSDSMSPANRSRCRSGHHLRTCIHHTWTRDSLADEASFALKRLPAARDCMARPGMKSTFAPGCTGNAGPTRQSTRSIVACSNISPKNRSWLRQANKGSAPLPRRKRLTFELLTCATRSLLCKSVIEQRTPSSLVVNDAVNRAFMSVRNNKNAFAMF